jgi:formate hydrogenlyase subunit 6/NADH:ubiquinone oxidoreductase subunit I
MAKEELWHGIPRKDIPWYPTVDADTCIGCTLCFAIVGAACTIYRTTRRWWSIR